MGYFEKNVDELMNLSSAELLRLAGKIERLAKQIKSDQPTIEMAVSAGVIDRSSPTVRHGTVSSYEGEAIVETSNHTWYCKGTKPKGNASSIWRQGEVLFAKGWQAYWQVGSGNNRPLTMAVSQDRIVEDNYCWIGTYRTKKAAEQAAINATEIDDNGFTQWKRRLS